MAKNKIEIRKGTIIGEWKIAKPLGSGGQGFVWEIRRVRRKSPPRALKACFLDDEKGRARFLREIQLLRECESPHVLTLIEAFESWDCRIDGLPDFAYYIAERCTGTLEDAVRETDNIVDHIDLFKQACDAVGVLHGRENPVLHRDIKPSNFFVAEEPRRLVIADFGIAREEEQDTQLTETHEVVGSPFFRAPEVLNGGTGTVRSDVYSMGRVLEWLLTHKLPQNMVPASVPRGVYLADDTCDLLDRVIAGATAIEPNQRYGSVVELRKAVPSLWLSVKPRVSIASAFDPSMSSTDVYKSGLALVRNNDKIGWRELENSLRKGYPDQITEWRLTYEKQPNPEPDNPSFFLDDLVNKVMPRLTLSLVGATTGDPALTDQRHVVEDLINIEGWRPDGVTTFVGAPWSLLFVYHFLHGACCLHLRLIDTALTMAQTLIPGSNRSEATLPLWRRFDISNGPDLFGGRCSPAWEYLLALPSKQPVLNKLFALSTDFKVGLASYSMLLSLLELASDAEKLAQQDDLSRLRLDIPPMFGFMDRQVRQSAASRVFWNRSVVEQVVLRTCAKLEDMRKVWPIWKTYIERFVEKVSHHEISAREVDLGDLA